MRFDKGWIKLHRSIEDGWMSTDVVAYALWLRLIIWANYKPSKCRRGGELKIVARGEILTSYRELAASFKIDRGVVIRILNCFQKDEMITAQPSHRGIHITICNYNKYQSLDDMSQATHATTDAATDAATDATPETTPETTHSKEVKNPKEGKKRRIKELMPTADSAAATIGSKIWASYSKAFEERWGQVPSRNAKSNSLCKKLSEKIPLENCEAVAKFYLTHNNQFYVAKMHPLELLVADAVKIEVEWKNGSTITKTLSHEMDLADYNLNNVKESLRRFQENKNK